MTEKQRRAWITAALRRLSYRWPPRSEAKRAARVARNSYRCASCRECFPNKGVHLDHVAPVVEPEIGFVDWNTYLARLLPPLEGWQVLCRLCHREKTNQENLRR